MTIMYELKSMYDRQKSFYSKAIVIEENDTKTLLSYTTKVAEIQGEKAYVFDTYSKTTLRHIKEFLLQNGFKAINKNQIEKDYVC